MQRRARVTIFLDDAFVKVDDGTVAEVMGLLVSLDLGFVMTGHAFFGCFPLCRGLASMKPGAATASPRKPLTSRGRPSRPLRGTA